MTAYVVVDVKINDPVRYEEYKKLAPPAVARYGGKYIARGGPKHWRATGRQAAW